MPASLNNVTKKTKYLFVMVALCLLLILSISTVFSNNEFERSAREVMLRKVGHELLLRSGDSTSRVLPVSRSGEHTYQLTFENEFTFQTDTLVDIIRRSLAGDKLTEDYIVNVVKCIGNDVVFGYAILKDKQNDIVACSGRPQLKSCYRITIQFKENGITHTQKNLLLGGIPLMALTGLLMLGPFKKRVRHETPDLLVLGNTQYNVTERLLITGKITSTLTVKENKLLLILATSPNTVIERSRLQKEIWEDEGVIVGRSLDMFISK
ncbi:MAG: response regulator transcription factor, partial [Pedobacter sp.]